MDKYLNLGCGTRFFEDKDWINIDFHNTNKTVVNHNLLKGIPLENESVKFVYHSHVLEHFTKKDAVFFIRECFRVLQKDGTIRIVLPDLEKLVNLYLKNLQKAGENRHSEDAKQKYEWSVILLYDQTTRTYSGGGMAQFLAGNLIDKKYYIDCCGKEIKSIIENSTQAKGNSGSSGSSKLFSISFYKEKLLRLLLGREGIKALNLGRFRLHGEIHQWMYDRISLSYLLEEVGFKEVKICTERESRFEKWDSFNLDIDENGNVYKPESIFIEAIKK
jgi:predicted SAM-dependent methyltransferase